MVSKACRMHGWPPTLDFSDWRFFNRQEYGREGARAVRRDAKRAGLPGFAVLVN
jgi:hypothetical protein